MLRSFRQRLFFRTIGGDEVLNFFVGRLRNYFLFEQVFLGGEGTRVDDALRVICTDAGKCGQVFLAGTIQVYGLSVGRGRVALFCGYIL